MVLVALALISVIPKLAEPVGWTPDGLFYQAQVYELQGEGQSAAIRRVYASQARISAARQPGEASRAGNLTWLKYSAQFYRRRWLVPAIAAALYPIAGDRSLLYSSALGYVAVGLLLFGLLRRRFPDATSLFVAALCLWLPPLRVWTGHPLTDSWGLALEIGALLAALLALERGGRWIALWVASMLTLSLTRDSTVLVLIAVGWIALTTRTRRSVTVLATGIAASVPALALFGAPLVQQLAWVVDGYRIPDVTTWSYVMAHYPWAAWVALRRDGIYPTQLGGPAAAVAGYLAVGALLAAVGYMLVAAPRRDAFFTLLRAAIVGGVVTVALAVSYTQMRLELVFVPSVAVALAFTIQPRGWSAHRERHNVARSRDRRPMRANDGRGQSTVHETISRPASARRVLD